MVNPHADRGNRGPLLWIAALVVAGAAIVAVAVATGALRLGRSEDSAPSTEQVAQQRCQAEVMKRLVAPDKAALSDVRTEPSTLDTEGRDFSSLTASEVGTTIQDHFDCRAYFVDGALTHTLVVFDHGH